MAILFNFIGIVTHDLARSLAFYRLVGLPLPEGIEGESHVEIEAVPGVRIGWDTVETVRSFDPGWTAPTGSHRLALAFACDTPAEVDETFTALIAAGHKGHVEPWDAFWGQRYATVLDPDGNAVDLFAALPGGAAAG
ncbi:VOC family protein [Klugiella xanthotipulae]|uniref:Glyoxalase/bleomycin resistance protein/dioxygenase superfamily protein n=1 Tax=Klugiella xanthotipulae TaxID=244735 RepID=A0A543HGX0_9MICO|nr:VOC family protein [Klugiella xanthotipulae]TQM57571.1 glyoxalase/bleomycin resistance protein/dioxygenase superfamily protein [Klugiella xanthotipulae]